MDMVAPLGPMYQAGTLSGNPLAMAAGCAKSETVGNRKAEIYPKLEKLSAELVDGWPLPLRTRAFPLSQSRGIHVHMVLPAGPSDRLGISLEVRHRSIREILSRNAGPWSLPSRLLSTRRHSSGRRTPRKMCSGRLLRRSWRLRPCASSALWIRRRISQFILCVMVLFPSSAGWSRIRILPPYNAKSAGRWPKRSATGLRPSACDRHRGAGSHRLRVSVSKFFGRSLPPAEHSSRTQSHST